MNPESGMKVEVRGTGRPLVYLHAGARWTKLLDRLAQTHTVHMPAFPGIDGTPTQHAIHSPRALGTAVADYVEKEIGKPCDVIGCSFGGAVALWLAIERPESVDHLVLECPEGLHDSKEPELLEHLERIQAVTLILHGTEDRIIPVQSMRLLKARLRRAFLVYVWAAGHDIEVDQPARVTGLVTSFLERSEAFVVSYA